jgi:hypothetical protein
MANYVVKSYSGAVASPVVVEATPVTLFAMTVNAAATAVLTLFDNASAASGTILFQKNFAAAANNYQITFPTGLRATAGITASVATATAQFSLAVG